MAEYVRPSLRYTKTYNLTMLIVDSYHSGVDPHYTCYPDSNRPILNFRSGFPPDHSMQAQEEVYPEHMQDSEKYEMVERETLTPSPESTREQESMQTASKSPGPKPPRESRIKLLRRKGRIEDTRAGASSRLSPARHSSPSSSSSSSSRQGNTSRNHGRSTASVAMPRNLRDRDPREPDPHAHRLSRNNPQEAYQAQLRRDRAEWERHTESALQEVHHQFKQRIEHLNSEITARDVHIRALKHTISKVRAGNSGVVSDSQIRDDYQYLISQLRNWTLSNFRGSTPTNTAQTISDFGIDPEADSSTFVAVGKFLAENSSRKFLAIGMLVMWYLDEHIFNPFLFGMEENEEIFFKDLATSFSKTSTPKEINFWRSTTLKMIAATESHKRKVNQRKKELVAQLESILVNTLPPTGGSAANSARRTENLKTIVDQAASLAITLHMQRPRYYLYCLPPGKKFEDSYMEPAEDADDDSDDGGSGGEERGSFIGNFMPSSLKGKQQRKVGLVIYPALIKSGNEDGEKYNENICICKAKVLKA